MPTAANAPSHHNCGIYCDPCARGFAQAYVPVTKPHTPLTARSSTQEPADLWLQRLQVVSGLRQGPVYAARK